MTDALRKIPDVIMVPSGWFATIFAIAPEKTILPWIVGIPTAILTGLKIYDWIDARFKAKK